MSNLDRVPEKPTEPLTQKTQPRPRKKGKEMPEPFDIPVPAKSQIMRDFEKIATATHEKEDDEENPDPAR